VNGVTQGAAKVATNGQETTRTHGMVSMTVEDAAMTGMTNMNEEIANAAAKADIDHSPCAAQRLLVLARMCARVGSVTASVLYRQEKCFANSKINSAVLLMQSCSTNDHKYTHVEAMKPSTLTLTPL